MMVRRVDARRDAPALRFLLLCVGWYLLTRRPERAVAFFRRLRRQQAAPKATGLL